MGWLSSVRTRFSNALNNPSAAIGEALNALREENLVQEIKGESDEPDFEKVFFVPEEKRLTLEFYKNNILHFFHPGSCFVATSILSAPETAAYHPIRLPTTIRISGNSLNTSSSMTSNSRTNSASSGPWTTLRVTAISHVENAAITITRTGGDILLFFAELIRNYIESYLVTSEALQNYSPGDPKSERDLLKRVNVTGQRMLKKKEISRIEALSRMNFQNAVELLTHENVLSQFTEDEGKASRQIL